MTTAELIEGHHVDQERRGLMPNSIERKSPEAPTAATSPTAAPIPTTQKT